MHSTLVVLIAAGRIATAFGGPDAQPTKPLATITALSDGHLPTCFTGHPTHPCPTSYPEPAKRDLVQDVNDLGHSLPIKPISMTASQGEHTLPTEAPALALRDAPLKVSEGSGDYIPEPNEWAIPQNFTFTDTISNTTSTASGTATLTTAHHEKTAAASGAHHHHGGHMQKHKPDDLYDTIAEDMLEEHKAGGGPSHPPGMPAKHPRDLDQPELKPTADAYAAVNSIVYQPTSEKAPSVTSSPSVAAKEASHQQSSANSTTNSHLSGMIGTLLNGAMFPGKMRAPSTTTTSSAIPTPEITKAASSESPVLVPIAMSEAPNTTAPGGGLQAFVHTINTESLSSANAVATPDTTLPSFTSASSTASASAAKNDLLESSKEALPESEAILPRSPEPREWDNEKFDKDLNEYLSTVVPSESSSMRGDRAAKTSSSAASDSTASPTTTSTPAAHSESQQPSKPTSFATSTRPTGVIKPPTTSQAVHWRRDGRRFIS